MDDQEEDFVITKDNLSEMRNKRQFLFQKKKEKKEKNNGV